MKILCDIDVDLQHDLGLIDIVDKETGEVLKTAKQLALEGMQKHPDIRPCGLRERGEKHCYWVEKRWCAKKCPHCIRVIPDDDNKTEKK